MTDTAPPLAPPSVADFHPAPEPSDIPGSHPRRRMLALPVLAVAAAAAACTPQQVEDWKRAQNPAPPPPPPGPTGPPSAVSAEMAVDKLTFGPTPGLVDQVRAMGVGTFIEQQLNPGSLPDAEALLGAYTTLSKSNMDNYTVAEGSGGNERLQAELDMATILRAVNSQRQLYELMCDFWSNHFNTWRNKTWMGFLKQRDHREVVRTHALGKFSDMLAASTTSVAMLDYLDNLPNDASTPGGVNENYAREVMELHTLGIVGGQQVYTEDDVHQVAKLVSGWQINWDAGPNRYTFRFAPWAHSRDAISVLGGAFSRPARSYGQGYDDGVRFFQVLAHHPSTAKHLATKLCRRFVGDNPPASLVDSAAAVYLANDTAIVPVLRHIFNSAEFLASRDQKVRRPFEHLVGCLRAMRASVPTDPEGNSADALRDALDVMGQPIYERPSPDGYPDQGPYWVSSAGLLERWEVTGNLARNSFGNRSTADKVVVDLPALLPAALPATVSDLVAWMAVNLANISMSGQDIADICTAGQVTPSAAATTLSTNASKLAMVVGLVFCHPNFQRR